MINKSNNINNSKYFLIKPWGGMNDILCVICMCLEYSIKHNRLLIIDCRKSLHFNDSFHNYFLINSKNIYKDNLDIIYEKIQYCSFFPAGVKNNFRELLAITFIELIDFDKDYKEDVLVYSSNRIVKNKIVDFFNLFRLHNNILKIFNERFKKMPKKYISVHVRNTDYKSNVELFLNENDNILKNNNIFISSDDINTINIFKKKYNNVYNFSNIIDIKNKGQGLHFLNRNDKDHKLFNIDTIVDLLLLANGDKFLFSCKHSGFSKSALSLFNNKNTLQKLLN
jgi:hypothetical protein